MSYILVTEAESDDQQADNSPGECPGNQKGTDAGVGV